MIANNIASKVGETSFEYACEHSAGGRQIDLAHAQSEPEDLGSLCHPSGELHLLPRNWHPLAYVVSGSQSTSL